MLVPSFDAAVMSVYPPLRHHFRSHYCDLGAMLTQNIPGNLVPVRGLWVLPLQIVTDPTIHLEVLLTSLVPHPVTRHIG